MKYFNIFLNKSLSLFFKLIIIVSSIVTIAGGVLGLYYSPLLMVIVGVLFITLTVLIVKRKINIKHIISKLNIKHILILSLVIRILYIVLIKTKPVSDFALMYESGADVANGNFASFHGFEYFARFAHDTITVIYFSIFYHITTNPLFLIKLINAILGTLSVYLLYKLVYQINYDVKSAKKCALIMGMFPPFIMYTSQTISENMGIPLYIGGVLFLFKAIKSNNKMKYIYYLTCGILISFGNMFRMVGYVFILAIILYLVLYHNYKEAIKGVSLVVISFALVLVSVSNILILSKITEVQLWNSKEPSITSILKGTNVKSFGMFNSEDAALPESVQFNADKIKKQAKETIKDRLTNTNPLILTGFYIVKAGVQWGCGDFGAIDMTGNDGINLIAGNKYVWMFYIGICYTLLLLRINNKLDSKNDEELVSMKFFYILLGGFIILYLITEMQPRYAFIVSWILIILGRDEKVSLRKKITE